MYNNIILIFAFTFVISIILLVIFLARRLDGTLKELKSIKRHIISIKRRGVSSEQLENLNYLYNLLEWPNGKLPATRGWAASPDFLIILVEWLFDKKPDHVVELGAGITTLVIARTLEIIGHGQLTTVEHDKVFAEITRTRLKRYGLHSDIIHAPLVSQTDTSGPWYDFTGTGPPIDLLVIDGPPIRYGEEVRVGAAKLFGHMSDSGVVMLDDAGRSGEREAARRWAETWPGFTQTFIDTEKGALLLQKKTSDRE